MSNHFFARSVRSVFCATLIAAVAAAPRGGAQETASSARVESLIKNLRAENVDTRRRAAIDVQMSDQNVQKQALPLLIEMLAKEKDGQVRLAVLDVLAQLGPKATAAVPALIQTLRTDVGGRGEEASHQDYRAALALAAIGKPGVEGLIGLLKERKESVRAEAIMALGRVGPDAGAAVPALIALLADPSSRIRREAAIALPRMGHAAVDPLILASRDANSIVRAGAVTALGDLVATSAAVDSAVVVCTRDTAPPVRAAAVRSLARLKVPDDVVLTVLKENLRHDDASVRLAVINALLGRRALLAPMRSDLQSLLTARNADVARHAAFLLGYSGPSAAPVLLQSLIDPKSRIEDIASALAHIGKPAVPLLIEAITAGNPRVRSGAALALGEIRPLVAGTAQKLTVGLSDQDAAARKAFLTAIGALGPRAGESVPAVRRLLGDPSAEIRILAIAIVAQSAPRDDRLVADLVTMVDDRDARAQRQAIDILRSLGPLGRPALRAVTGRLNSPDPEVRMAAAEMIGSHGEAAAEAVPALGGLLGDPSARIQTVAARTLGSMGKAAQPALPRIVPLLSVEQVEVREAAAVTLGSLELDVEVIRPHLARALNDKTPEVRRAAMKAIQKYGPQGAIFVPDIIMLAQQKENMRAVERMLRRFERTGPDIRSLPELLKQLEHGQDSVRLLAIKFLGLAGPSARDAIPALERMRDDPSAEVRKQAQLASEQIKNKTTPSRQRKSARNEAAAS